MTQNNQSDKIINPVEISKKPKMKHNHSGGDSVRIRMRNLAGPLWEDMRVPGSSVQKGSSAPDLVAFLGSGDLKVNAFDGGVTSEQVYFTIQFSHSRRNGSDIYPHVHWTPTTADSGNVKWQLEYSWADIDGTFSAPTTISKVCAAEGIAWEHLFCDMGKIDGSNKKRVSSMMVCRLFRDPIDVEDTYEHDAAFLEFDVHYEMDIPGSRKITSKY